MKAVQVMLDEELLDRLDATEEVRKEGRSAVLRRAVSEYLVRRRELVIREGYRQAYASGDIAEELAGWEEQGEWPPEE